MLLAETATHTTHTYNLLHLLSQLAGQPRWAWITPEESLVAWGVSARLQTHSVEALAQQLTELNIPDAGDIRLFGGMPFDPAREPDSLWAGFRQTTFTLPQVIYRQTANESMLTRIDPTAPLPVDLSPCASHPLPAARWHDEMSRAAWDALLTKAQSQLAAGRMDKVVLARTRRVDFVAPPDLTTAFAALYRRYPHTTLFYFEPAPGQVFMGATPEVLVRVTDCDLDTVALAGSAPRGETRAEDARLGAALLASAKNRREQAIVAERIRRDLAPLCAAFSIPDQPRLRRLPNIQHLETPVQARLLRPGILPVAAALHPTPALAGQPREAALAFIRQHEPQPRGLYGAPLGWITPHGDGILAVAIRSAVFNGARGRLFAGAGILPTSDPASEWEETALKFRPMMEALGLSDTVPSPRRGEG